MTSFNRRTTLKLTISAASLWLAASTASAASMTATAPPATAEMAVTPEEARQIAAEAYLYFYPLVSMDVTRGVTTNVPAGQSQMYGPANAFSNLQSFPTADFRAVVRPNFDTLYSSGWVDLTQGPVVLTVPDTHGRYYLLPLLDMWSNVFAAPGKRTSGTGPGHFVIVPPGWTGWLPANIEHIQAPTPYVWIIGRTQTNGPADYDAVHKIQEGYRLTRLADWGKPPVAPIAKIDPTVDMKTPPKVQVDTMAAGDYFHYAADLLKVNPPQVTDWSQLKRLERIGIVRGKPWNIAALPPEIRAAVEQGRADALKTMSEQAASVAPIVNGWQMNTSNMGVYGNSYFKRAIVAQLGLGANQPEDAIYPLNVADADGKPVTADNRYVMHFDKAKLPPVNAFWSLTMYDAEGFQVANPINRFAIGDRDALKFNPDGSLDLYIQHDDPGTDKQANWLPAPASGALGLTMRLYAPKPEALDGRWAPPPVRKL